MGIFMFKFDNEDSTKDVETCKDVLKNEDESLTEYDAETLITSLDSILNNLNLKKEM